MLCFSCIYFACLISAFGVPLSICPQCMEATAGLAQKHAETDARGLSYKHHVPVQRLQWAVTGATPATVSVGGSASVPASTWDPSQNWHQVNLNCNALWVVKNKSFERRMPFFLCLLFFFFSPYLCPEVTVWLTGH